MRQKKDKRWTVAVAITILYILLVFSIDGIQRKFIYNDRTAQLTTYYSQLESFITQRLTRYYKLLRSWSYHLEHSSTSGIESVRSYISSEVSIWDVNDVYLINSYGEYIDIEGREGTLDIDERILSDMCKFGKRNICPTVGRDEKQYELFILGIKPGEYEDFTYGAIGMTIDSAQIRNRLTIKSADMSDSENYLVDMDGNRILTNVERGKSSANILSYLEDNAEESAEVEEIRNALAGNKTGIYLLKVKGIRYYVTCLPCGNVGNMLLCLTPRDKIEAGIAQMRTMNNLFLLAAFGVVMGLSLLIIRYTGMQDMLEVANTANETKTRFLANMSHDFRTPMNAMSGYLTLMKENADDPEKVKEFGEKAESAHRNMLNMINSVLDLSKMETGSDEVIKERFSLSALLNNVRAQIEPLAEEKLQKLTISKGTLKPDYFIGDSDKLMTVITNLLRNAVTYTQENGEIELEIITENDYIPGQVDLRIEVTDNGIGMSKEFLNCVFEPFAKEERQNANRQQGTGLGLAVTKNLVELMGGTIEVESVLNAGTVFTIRMTLEIAEKTEKEEMEEIGETLSTAVNENNSQEDDDTVFEGMRFLAAEDNELNAEILTEILKMKGAECCDISEDGQKVLEDFRASEPGYYDMILMDIQMPVMDGYEAARAIRELAGEGREDAGSIPILAMSANAFKEDIDKTSKSGMDAHIAKPIDVGLFGRTVRALKNRGHVV